MCHSVRLPLHINLRGASDLKVQQPVTTVLEYFFCAR